MTDDEEVIQLIMEDETREANLHEENNESSEASNQQKNYKWWFLISIFTLFLIAGESIAVLLQGLYFDKGGKSRWLITLVQTIGFPLLLPIYFLSKRENPKNHRYPNSPSILVLGLIYVSFGILTAADCLLYSLGLLYLPVSTYSLICATQLAFNAFFAFFLNSQKFTPFIINSLFLLTISSILLVFQSDSGNSDGSSIEGQNFAIGFICTLLASAGYGLILSLTQLFFQRVLKKVTLKGVLDRIIYPSIVASICILVGLFGSGEWWSLKGEMEDFSLGKVSYLMILIGTAICWQFFAIGSVWLTFEVSSLFSNVISTLGLPVVPFMAVVLLGDEMNGVKVISLVLAIWGFVSYVYQHYLDDHKSKTQTLCDTPQFPLHKEMRCPKTFTEKTCHVPGSYNYNAYAET